ncbi:uncharacterized protein MYCFIDRAFT_195435 [Pseudocercospora fijiensis CIRAD86]|uniref:Uncharacterized protein n=1 Tax=Pseudocercospora fijiensis (strain CIRAD86) TaxID=383855 RepID=M3AIF3_PSEFD|nr:uncharacterized protein MYCFIDRAFT_195435 [Pseudocercospora fijiensis CIRAD86]EME84371.1 hypothetical protein MYCFIDRAFT_195435 [Pseudocercospora fijiensis CIRAD86]
MDRDTTADLADSSPAAETASFAWENTDTTGLAPTNLPLAKVQRAWERRPQSPFSRRRFRVGKIFKRNATNAQPVANTLAPALSVNIRQNAGRGTPLKAVKKMRVARDSLDALGSGALVSDWECRGSPTNRRIVTRNSLGKKDLIALPDEDQNDAHVDEQNFDLAEGGEDVERTSIDILSEHASQRVEDEEAADADEWEDESDTELGQDEEAEEQAWERCRLDPIAEKESMSPSDAVVTSSWPEQHATTTGQALAVEDAETASIESDARQNEHAPELVDVKEDEDKSLPTDDQPPIAAATHEEVVLPEGFVSPVATRRRRSVNQTKRNTSRRRTLPTSFAAPSEKQERIPADQRSTAEGGDLAEGNEKTESVDDPAAATYQIEDARPGDEELVQATIEQEAQEAPNVTRNITPEPSRDISTEPNTPSTESQLVTEYQQENGVFSPNKLASSPVPTIEGSHPRLPLRRSPRRQRQSSSPVKRRSILKQTLQKPHLVAFTPIKKPSEQELQPESQTNSSPKADTGPASSPLPIDFSGITSPAAVQDELPIRSSSAPPEEPQMTPRKPKQPRISDDTALLEAFLKRASESKSGCRVSDTARRESLENRRNSNTVRQALASPALKSPAPSDVLADLDPNSPSPRKPLGASFSMTVPEKRELEYEQDPIRDDEDELAAESGPPQKFGSRKSGRTRKKPETLPATTYDGKRKIQIRTNSDGVVLKKTEAQALALETRKNTRLNKSGAVMPPLRLTKLAAEKKKDNSQPDEDDAMDVEQAPVPGRKGIKWAETLVSFYQGEDEPEGSMMADELGNEQPFDSMAPEQNILREGEMSLVTAPPASSTPSKPKLRRLKPQKPTASTPAKPSLPLEQTLSKGEDEQEVDAKPKPKASTRRKVSRIATPAKVKGTTLLGHSEEEEEEVEEQAQLGELKPRPTPMPSSVQNLADEMKLEEPRATPVVTKKSSSGPSKKKHVVASKLPAPTASQQTHATTGLAAGKENSLIASPPKKRSTKASNMTAGPPLRLGEAKGLAAKFDLGKAALKPADNDKSAAPGISSPAKKAPRIMPARSTISNERRREIEPAPGLGSPAKKRTRGMAS